MRSLDRPPATLRGRLTRSSAAVAAVLALSGCSDTVQRGWLPGDSSNEATNHTGRITDLWVGSWIAALLTGLLVWGLTIWVVVAYRRRKDDTGLPAQVRYNVPLEIMYTVVPMMMVAVLFYFTARDQAIIEEVDASPDHQIEVVGKQWSWDFNYLDEDVYTSGVQAQLTGEEGVEESLPTLVLPAGESVKLTLNARDVIHSFWVPGFLYKKDMIPGRENQYSFTPQAEGTYQGKCAELCGEYHATMLFNVEVVSPAEYDAHLEELREAGNIGRQSVDLGGSTGGRPEVADSEGAVQEDDIGEGGQDGAGIGEGQN